MRRAVAAGALLVAAIALVAYLAVRGGDGDAYRVRAIFMNAFSVVPGEDVKVAGVTVGRIESLDVTPDQRAAVVLRITEPAFQDFRRDAECTIRPQSLIGEKFVECTPSQPRAQGTQPPPPLRRIERGEGEGQYLLPVANTSRPVDLDLVSNVMRLPYRQRLRIIINELGTGLAGRGDDLRQAIRNASPALKQTDRVLRILADQNATLRQVARDGDRILAPLARDRARVASFVTNAGDVAQVTASRDRALEASLQRLPTFLRELTPTMRRLGGFAAQASPVLSDLGARAPDINRVVGELGPFSRAATPALRTLGDASVVGRDALVRSRPLIRDVGALARTAQPLSRDLSALLRSVRDTGGVERLMDLLFYQVAAINGFDAFGHYLRAGLIVNNCSTYAITQSSACTSNFQRPDEGVAARAASARERDAADAAWNDPRRSINLRRQDAAIRGLDPDQVAPLPAAPSEPPAPAAAPTGAAPGRPAARSQPAGAAAQDPAAPLLDYLLGG